MRDALPPAFAWIDDPIIGRLLAVGGSMPGVARVIAADGLNYQYVFVDPEEVGPNTELFRPAALIGYHAMAIYDPTAFGEVDLLVVLSGQYSRGDHARRFWLWADEWLWPLTERELRQALTSRWLRHARGIDGPVGRGILLREEG